jgi:hypothetical protein
VSGPARFESPTRQQAAAPPLPPLRTLHCVVQRKEGVHVVLVRIFLLLAAPRLLPLCRVAPGGRVRQPQQLCSRNCQCAHRLAATASSALKTSLCRYSTLRE